MISMNSPALILIIALLLPAIVESQRNLNSPSPPMEFWPLFHRFPTPPPPVLLSPPLTQPAHVSPSPRFAVPPPPLPPPPAPSQKHLRPEQDNLSSYESLSPPLVRKKPNIGKKIGLMFVGVAAILQVCIVAFLLIRRRQLLKSVNGY